MIRRISQRTVATTDENGFTRKYVIEERDESGVHWRVVGKPHDSKYAAKRALRVMDGLEKDEREGAG